MPKKRSPRPRRYVMSESGNADSLLTKSASEDAQAVNGAISKKVQNDLANGA